MEKGEVPVPDVDPCPVAEEKASPEAFFGSFGGGGVYTSDEDPMPEFNYISPTLLPSGPKSPSAMSCHREPATSKSSCGSSITTGIQVTVSTIYSPPSISTSPLSTSSISHAVDAIAFSPCSITGSASPLAEASSDLFEEIDLNSVYGNVGIDHTSTTLGAAISSTTVSSSSAIAATIVSAAATEGPPTPLQWETGGSLIGGQITRLVTTSVPATVSNPKVSLILTETATGV